MKYMGSKARIAKHILPIILKDRKEGQCYVEPFVGGANMIDKVDGWRIGADSNEYLIAFLNAMKRGEPIPSGINKEMYDHVSLNKSIYSDWFVGLVGFCFTYSAKWFGGFIGNSNDVVCAGRDRIGESYRAAEKVRSQVQGVDLLCISYQNLPLPKESKVYCDPPYAGTTKYKDDFDHDVFWQWCREKAKEGHEVFISEYSAPDDFVCVWQKEIHSGLNTNTTKKGVEKLFVHESQHGK